MVNRDEKVIKKSTPWNYIYVAILLLAVFIQYRQTLDFGFVWDDKIVIQENPRVKNGIKAIPELFTKVKSPYRHDQYGYRPVTLVSFALEIELWGVNPYYHHLMNLLYYALLCILIFNFLKQLFKNYHPVFSFLIALIFTVHPLHVEVVANIKSRDEILAMLFVIISLSAYVKFIRSHQWIYLVGVVLTYFMAFLSKENAITSLLLFPLIYLIEYKSIWRSQMKRMILSNIHVLILIIISVLIFQLAESSSVGKNEMIERNIVKEDDILGNSLFHTDGLLNKLPTVLVILILYLKMFVIPYPLVFYYGYNHIPVRGWLDAWVWLAILVIGGIIYLIYRFSKNRPELWLGALFFIFSISIYLHIIRKLSDTMADRFMFMPSLGLSMLFVGFVGLIFNVKWTFSNDSKSKNALTLQIKKSLVFSFMAIGVVYTILSYNRTGVWKDDKTLVFTDMKNLENCSRVHYYYANILWTDIKKNPSLQPKLEKEMIHHYKRSIEIAPQYVYYSRMELGMYYSSQKRYQDALDIFVETNQLFPDRGPVLFNIGQNLYHLGEYQASKDSLLRAREFAPYYEAIPYLLILIESKLGNFDIAIEIANKAMKDFPNDIKIYKDALTVVYSEKKDKDKFIQQTLELLSYGANPQVVYQRIIHQLEEWGMREEANFYKIEARKKGFVY
ncbi:MAG: tetratricopeptide repeat protein [Flavobacteriales bacterium]|nr:tetratricopeptide repeat protein [Flavobacteriales bacterium]